MQLRQDRMDSQERMVALFNYQKPDRVPIGAFATGFNTCNMGYTAADAYNDPEKSFEGTVWTSEQYGWDPLPQFSGHTILVVMDFGGEVRLPKGEYEGALVIKSHPVQTEKDIDNLKLPDPKRSGRIPLTMRYSQLQMEHGFPVYFYTRSPFTMAANFCGVEQFCKWLYKKPELCERLMTLATDHIFNVLGYWIETFGSNKIIAWMSSPSESNQVISPKHMEKFALSFHREYHRRLKALAIRRFGIHLCGDQNLNLPLLAESPPWPHPSVLSFGHEVDLETAAKYFPEDIIFGNIEPVFFQFGTPQKVYDLCKTAIEKGKKAPGGFILGPGCNLPVHALPVNVYAMTKAVNDFGWYE